MIELILIQGRSPEDEYFIRWQQGRVRGRVGELYSEHFPLSDDLRGVLFRW
jgi:hypothetical protein